MKTRLVAEDLYNIFIVNHPQISPDGGKVLFVKTNTNQVYNNYQSNLWCVNTEKEIKQLTNDNCSDMPRWSSDGKAYCYISKKNGTSQLYISRLDDIGSEQITTFDGEVGYPSWAPDNKKILFIGTTRKKKSAIEPIVVNTLKIKSDGEKGLIDRSKERQIYVVDVETKIITQVTPNNFHIYNPEWHQVTTPMWSPDGSRIVFVSQVQDEVDRDMNPYKADVFIVESSGGVPKRINKKDGPAVKAAWNDAGNAIFFIGSYNEYLRPTILKLFRYDLETEKTEVLSKNFDRTLEDFTVYDTGLGYSDTYVKESADGKNIYFIASDRGCANIFKICVETNEVSKVVGGKRRIYGFDLCKANNTLVFSYATSTNPGEISIFNLDTKEENKLTEINRLIETERFTSEPESITYMSSDGLAQEGFVIKPIGYKEGKQYPCILEIHGGPYAQYGHSMMLEFQLLASRGYSVMFCNPRGSRGYGQELTYAQIGNYGTRDYEDIMTFVDEAIKCGFIDTARLGVTGGSYGGFMTNWIACHSNRFKVGVTQVGISNMISKYAMSDTGYFSVEQMYTGVKEPDLEKMWDISPLKYVKNIKIPLLILHSEKDMRCPIGQGEELYVALKLQGNDTTMIRFPESSHRFASKGIPSFRVYRLNSIVDYFDKYIEKKDCDYTY